MNLIGRLKGRDSGNGAPRQNTAADINGALSDLELERTELQARLEGGAEKRRQLILQEMVDDVAAHDVETRKVGIRLEIIREVDQALRVELKRLKEARRVDAVAHSSAETKKVLASVESSWKRRLFLQPAAAPRGKHFFPAPPSAA